MIILFSDYGIKSPYLAQVESAIIERSPEARVINLIGNAPRNNPRASAYLLAAYAMDFPIGSIFFSVVDPGVGNEKDRPVILDIDGKYFVGPDNGLFDILIRRAEKITAREINWRPGKLSLTFHGRDLYAPVCGMLAAGTQIESEEFSWQDQRGFADDIPEIIYIDHFGNCISGQRAENIAPESKLGWAGELVSSASTFSDVAVGEAFWYENANGLLEISVNGGDAAKQLKLDIGSVFTLN